MYRARCEECADPDGDNWTAPTYPWEKKARRDARRHNRKRHDGDSVAEPAKVEKESVSA